MDSSILCSWSPLPRFLPMMIRSSKARAVRRSLPLLSGSTVDYSVELIGIPGEYSLGLDDSQIMERVWWVEGDILEPVSREDRHGPADLLTGAGRPEIPMNDILMLASTIASAVVKVTSGKVAIYNRRDYPGAGRSTKGYKERLRDKVRRLWRWSKEEDEHLLAMVKENCSWSKIEKHFPQRTAVSLHQRVLVFRRENCRA
ncbi:hypothetical protein ACJ73_08270 [Blastomyces percursus]|uniref:Uncharacterized protein n=1 Tax=Blastomyces percursus TaxID=1658174 RepID=A0A1J9QJN1_9EURO|nr:hypothetical protein ACJ73_08270 [Blastomyces percursus]